MRGGEGQRAAETGQGEKEGGKEGEQASTEVKQQDIDSHPSAPHMLPGEGTP